MIANAVLVQESLGRAQSQQIEELIHSLAQRENQRGARPQQIEQRRTALLRQVQDPLEAQTRLERILQGNELTDFAYLAQGVICGRAVCRIAIRRQRQVVGYGTGFLVAPGVLLTNHHVLPTPDDVRDSLAQFRYERDLRGQQLEAVEFALRLVPEPILIKELDLALVAVEARSADGQALDPFGWLKLNPQPGKAFIGEYLTIVQHPKGERKQICVRENKLLKYDDNGPYIWYQTDTVAGSSGSPVFNNSWEVVALHHSSVPRTKKVKGQDVWLAKNGAPWTEDMGEDQVAWIANEGVRISRIADYLQSQYGQHPLVRQMLSANEPPITEAVAGGDGPGPFRVQTDGKGTTRILLPIEIGVRVGVTEQPLVSAALPSPATVLPAPVPATDARAVEKVVIDQNSYPKRPGYDPKFLGGGLVVPLPQVVSSKFGKPLVIKGTSVELKYWTYSIVMNQTRRLAFFSAANVDSAQFRGNRDADGDTWYLDPRVTAIDKKAQVGPEFYKKQSTFEADRTRSPFDQGHLTRRKDIQWGGDDETAKRNGDDSYHYTNCTPQHWQFNQDNKANGLWFRLEETAINMLSPGTRLCLINGVVFDAPLSPPGPDGRLRLDLQGKRVPDGVFGGVKIPKMFFKVIAYRAGKVLQARAFVVTQEDLLATVEHFYPAERAAATLTNLEVRLYQVKISDLEKLAGLNFGGLADHDVPVSKEALTLSQWLPIKSERELVF